MDKLTLQKYNSAVFHELTDAYPTLQLGFFNGASILFLGQNPGMPYSAEAIEETKNILAIQDPARREAAYEEMIRITLMGNFIINLIGKDWSKISLTNVVKIPTADNAQPNQAMLDIFLPIVKRQIELLQPKIVLCLGRFAGSQFDMHTFYQRRIIDDVEYMMLYHPAFLYRTNRLKSEVEKINNILETL